MNRRVADQAAAAGVPTAFEPPPSAGLPGPSQSSGPAPGRWWLLGFVALPIIAYGISTFAVHRPPSGYNSIWDGWVYNIAQGLPAIPVFWRVRRSRELRAAWLTLGLGIVFITAGNLVYTFHDQNLHPIPDPAPSDAVYLVAYAAFIIGVAIFTQSSFGPVHASVRLDGAIAGLAIGALAGMAWFEPLLHMTGRPLEIAVNMAYPLCDLVLIVLLVAGLAPNRYRTDRATILLMVGIAWFVIGDLITLDRIAAGTYVPGTPLDETWLIGLFFIAAAATARDRRRLGDRRRPVSSPEGITAVPVVFGVVSLGVLAASLVRHDSALVQAMAITALGLVIGRMWMTLREVRQSVANYEDARTDDLTGLANRRAFLERLESPAFLKDLSGRRAGVLLVDLDGFKEVNDALGHGAGDDLLRALAGRFDRRLGDKGLLARLGGDEYAFACMVGSEDDLVEVANEFSAVLLDPCEVDGTTVRVGASIGAAMSESTGSSSDELLRCADVAMYESKRNKCGVSVYRAEADPNSRDRLALLYALQGAIDERELLVYFQPTLDMRTATLHGLEALVRWQHPSLGLLEADSFVPLAERNALMPQLTRAVLDLSLAQAAHLDSLGHHLQMSVNISRHDLVDEALPDYIDSALEHNHFPHSRLTLEITESALGGDPDRAERCVRELRARGLRISIDDFGVGYSSMSRLLELSIDELKIDKSFILGMIADPRARAIVRSSVELARALQLSIVAEGIETVEVFEALRGVGADIGQGNVIGPPMAPQRLESFLSQSDLFHPLRPRSDRLLATGG